MSTIIGTKILRADEPRPKLPEGWRFMETGEEVTYRAERGWWMVVLDPQGNKYYVGEDKLFPLKPSPGGNPFLDTEHPVALPK